MYSHKPQEHVVRAIQAPRRSNGKLRVAAILEAAAALIDEKGFDGTTMADIAESSGTKVGSLYRFFPNKESVADTLLEYGLEYMVAAFDQFQTDVSELSVDNLADGLMTLVCELFAKPGFRKLLDSGKEWSEKREHLRRSVLQRIGKCLKAYSPSLSKKAAADMAVVILLHSKTVATNRAVFASRLGISVEFRDMTRLYLRSRMEKR